MAQETGSPQEQVERLDSAKLAGLPRLPLPSQLAVRDASLGGPANDWRAEGSEFLAEYPSAHLAAAGTGSSGDFSPAYTPGGPLSGLAYGVFCLDTPDYAGPNFYVLDWDSAPAAGSAFMAVANFQLNRWEWFAVPANNIVSPGALAFDERYRNANDNTFVAVCITGSAAASLDYVRLGDNLPPVPELTATPLSGSIGDNFTLNASGSLDPDGEIVSYSFFANNQTFDMDADGVLQNLMFSEGGDQFCVVTVTDDDGQQEQANVTIPVTLGPVAMLNASAARIDLGATIDFDASASTGGEGNITKYEFDPEGDSSFIDNGTDATLEDFSYASAGYYNATLRITTDSAETDTVTLVIRVDWRRSFNSAGYVGVYELRPAADGGCFVCGTVENDAVLMRLGPDGSITWKRRLRNDTATDTDDFSGMVLDGLGYVYVAGRQHYDSGMGVRRFLKLLQVDITDAGLGFERVLDLGSEQPNAGDLDLLVDSQGDLHLVGRIEDGTRTDLCVFRTDSNGVFEQGRRWDDNGSTISRSFGGAAIDGGDNIYINSYSGLESGGAVRQPLLLSLTRDHSERWSRLLNVSHNAETPDLLGEGICTSGDTVFLTATLRSSDNYRAMVLKVDADGSLALNRAFGPQANVTEFGLGHCASDGLGGFWCGGITQEIGSNFIDAMLFRFSSNLDIQLSKHYGLNGFDDDAENVGPVAGNFSEIFYGGYAVQHGSVFNDYVYNFETLDSVDWQTPALPQDLDAFNTTTYVSNSTWEDFSFADTDNGGGFVMRYHP